MSVWGGEWTCGIGCATSDSLKGPFIDNGMMFRSNGINVRILLIHFILRMIGINIYFGVVFMVYMQ